MSKVFESESTSRREGSEVKTNVERYQYMLRRLADVIGKPCNTSLLTIRRPHKLSRVAPDIHNSGVSSASCSHTKSANSSNSECVQFPLYSIPCAKFVEISFLARSHSNHASL